MATLEYYYFQGKTNFVKCTSMISHCVYRHGPLFRILGELESRQGNKGKARELFWKGIQMDPKYSSTYHVAALFEAKNGNLVVSLSIISVLSVHLLNFYFPETRRAACYGKGTIQSSEG